MPGIGDRHTSVAMKRSSTAHWQAQVRARSGARRAKGTDVLRPAFEVSANGGKMTTFDDFLTTFDDF